MGVYEGVENLITIKSNGQIYVPKNECFIGYSGDNLKVTREFLIEDIKDISLIYRMFLKFDDGTCNYFLLESEVQENGTVLFWEITNDQIFKDGIVQLQIKASNSSGEVFHSAITNMIVNTSIEFTDYFAKKNNSEFLEYEEKLNNLYKSQEEANQSAHQAMEKAETTLATANSTLDVARESLATAEETLNSSQQARSDIDEVFDKIDEHIAIYENMTFDTEPTENSNVPVTSGGVYSALNNKITSANIGYLAPTNQYNNITDIPAIYDVHIPSTYLGGTSENENIYGKVFNFQNETQLFLTDDGRVFTRKSNTDDNFVQTIFTKDEITRDVQETGSGTLTAITDTGDDSHYSYIKNGKLVTLFVYANINSSTTNPTVVFKNLPYTAVQGAGVETLALSFNKEPYSIKINNDDITLTHLAQGSYDDELITAEDTLHFQITYGI